MTSQELIDEMWMRVYERSDVHVTVGLNAVFNEVAQEIITRVREGIEEYTVKQFGEFDPTSEMLELFIEYIYAAPPKEKS